MSNTEKKIWIGILICLLLAFIITWLAGVNPRIQVLFPVLALVPLGALLPTEYMIIGAALIIPVAPHSRFFSEALPAMSIEYPFIALCGAMFLIPAVKQARRLKGIWLLIGCWTAFSLVAVISWLGADIRGFSDLFALNRFAYYAALLVMVAAANPKTFDLQKICRAVYAAAFVVALFGLCQYFLYELFVHNWYINAYFRPGLDNYSYLISDRVLSTFGNPNLAGVYLSIMLITGIGSNFWGFNRRWARILWVTVLLSAIILTRSRTAYICLVSGYLLMTVFFKRNRLKTLLYSLGTGVVVSGLMLLLLRHSGAERILDVGSTLQARFKLWDMALERFTTSPLLGVGPNPRLQIPGENLATVPIDNIYLTVLTSYGIIGMLVLVATLAVIVNQLIKAAGWDYKSANVARGLGAGLIMLLIGGLTGDFLFNVKIAGSYFLLLGCLLLASTREYNGPPKVLLVGNAKSIHVKRWGQSLAQKGLNIHVLSPRAYPVEGCTVHEVGSEASSILSWQGILYFIKRLLLVEKRIQEISPDIVHIHGAFSFGWYATSFTTGPVITSIWGSDIYRYAAASRRKNLLVKSTLKRADLVTVPTREVALDVKAKFKSPKIFILPWGVDEQIFYPPRTKDEINSVKEQLHISADTRLILSPRSFTPLYNVETILQSITGIVQKNNNICFCFLLGTGTPEYFSQMQKKAEELEIGAYTRWISEFRTPAEMARLFRAADAFISVPDTDNIGSTITEGMACGSIPVIKKLHNYRCLYEAGAVMISVSDVTPENLAAAVDSALKARNSQNSSINRSAAYTLGTWEAAVNKTVETYDNLLTLKIPPLYG